MKKGFTLIELLVVIAVIAMIISFIFVSAQTAKAKNRDARREEDMKQIQNALTLHETNARRFPLCNTEVVIEGTTDCLSQVLVASGAILGVPTDPLGKSQGICGQVSSFVYCYQSTDGFSYTLRYALETNSIPGKSAGWQSVNP
ncbi:MAG: type II secretion system protein [bacterium]|nr:type II secretion system protein [bacterium]